jgi:4-diphosphocytidyl-2-C-methyl-D-erythritol kinase
MVSFPFAKINVGLNVMERRVDGYHEIESILVPIPLCDVLELILDRGLDQGEVRMTRSGLPVPGALDQDLCMRACVLFSERVPVPGIRMHLHKVIPMGAGLGGGSSDGTHTLLTLNKLLGDPLNDKELYTLATQLGSDCAFFLKHATQLATGRGEKLRPYPLELKGLWLVLVNPGTHVSTAEVYGNTVTSGRSWNLREVPGHLEDQLRLLGNDMEGYVLTRYPEVGQIKSSLLDRGAFHAAMSGSGSSVFGLFRDVPPAMTWPEGHGSWTFQL